MSGPNGMAKDLRDLLEIEFIKGEKFTASEFFNKSLENGLEYSKQQIAGGIINLVKCNDLLRIRDGKGRRIAVYQVPGEELPPEIPEQIDESVKETDDLTHEDIGIAIVDTVIAMRKEVTELKGNIRGYSQVNERLESDIQTLKDRIVEKNNIIQDLNMKLTKKNERSEGQERSTFKLKDLIGEKK